MRVLIMGAPSTWVTVCDRVGRGSCVDLNELQSTRQSVGGQRKSAPEGIRTPNVLADEQRW
jgi:hypothetical protein